MTTNAFRYSSRKLILIFKQPCTCIDCETHSFKCDKFHVMCKMRLCPIYLKQHKLEEEQSMPGKYAKRSLLAVIVFQPGTYCLTLTQLW